MITLIKPLIFNFSFSDELGYLVDAIVNEDKIGSFDKRPNDLSIEVNHFDFYMQPDFE